MRRLTCGAVVLLAFLTTSANARAAPITIGNPLLSPVASTSGSGISATLLNLTIAEPGALPTSPVSGAILSWHLQGSGGGPFRLRVLRPAGPDTYTSVGTSAAVTAAAADTQNVETFATTLPIQAGDLVAIDVVKGVRLGITANPASVIGAIEPILVEGGTDTLDVTTAGAEWAFNAVVQPAPTITAVNPKAGSFKGGTKVTITGTDLTGASAVTFGGIAAKRFTVDSESKITAVAPARKKLGSAPIAVTTIAGSATFSRFKLTACVVPKLKQKTLKAAKKKLKKAGCKVGKVTKVGDASAKTGVVAQQGEPAGKKLAPGTKIAVTLS